VFVLPFLSSVMRKLLPDVTEHAHAPILSLHDALGREAVRVQVHPRRAVDIDVGAVLRLSV
jgi:hypothetical protein